MFCPIVPARRARPVSPTLVVTLLALAVPLPSAAQTRGVSALPVSPAQAAVPVSARPSTSLAMLLAHAKQHAPALRVAEKRKGYAAAARAGAEPLLRHNPTFDIGIGPRFNGAVSRDFDFVAALSQPVEIGGERGARLEAAERLSERLAAEATSTWWEVRCHVVGAFNNAVLAREQTLLAEQVQQFSQELLQVVQLRLAAGEATAIDVRVAELDVATAKHARLSAEQLLQDARLRLAEVGGWPIDAPPEVNSRLTAPQPAPPLATVLATVDRHPALSAQRAAVGEARSKRALAAREGTLTPVFGVQVSREGAAGSPANYILLGTLGVPLPLWQRNQQQREQTRVDEAVATEEQQALDQLTRARVARAHAEMTAAYRRLQLFADEVAPRIEENLTLLRRGFEAGELSLLDVASARERLLTARRHELVAYADYYRAAVELELVAGADSNRFVTAEGTR